MKEMLPKQVKNGECMQTPLQWMLTKVRVDRETYEKFFPAIIKIADIIHSAPIINAWPERGQVTSRGSKRSPGTGSVKRS